MAKCINAVREGRGRVGGGGREGGGGWTVRGEAGEFKSYWLRF